MTLLSTPPEPLTTPMRLIHRLFAWRDALLASPSFQRVVASNLLTRRLVARRTRELFDICAGFVYSQVLYACVELDLFTLLAEGPLSIAALAPRLALSEDAARRLLLAATSLRLTARRGPDIFGLGELGAALRGNPGVVEMIKHHAMFYADVADPVALLRRTNAPTRLSRYWPYANPSAQISETDVVEYSALMSASQSFVARDVLDAFPLGSFHRLMDVGGGDGTFLSAVATRNPDLSMILFDLPAVASVATARFVGSQISQRTQVIGGSFRTDPLPAGADIISLIRVAHDHDDDVVLALLANILNALPEGGTLLIAEPLADTRGAEAIGAAYFGFYLLAMGTGRARSFGELHAMLTRTGFVGIRQIATRRPLLTGLIIAQRGKKREKV